MKKRHFFYLFSLGFLLMIITLFFVLNLNIFTKKNKEYQKTNLVTSINKPAEKANDLNPILVKKTVKKPITGLVNNFADEAIPMTETTQNSIKNGLNSKVDSLIKKPVKTETNVASEKSTKSLATTSTNASTISSINTSINVPVNISDYKKQIEKIKEVAPALYQKNKIIYQSINNWINQSLNINELSKVGLKKYKVSGGNNYKNVLLTGYYTPIVKARRQPNSKFKYPIYKMPTNLAQLPSRELIYNGALAGKGLELAYSDSLMGNFMMDIQGSAYIDFEDGSPLVYFSYAGRNGYDYSSLGRVLIDNGEIKRNQLSMQSVLAWADTQEESKLKSLLMQNNSFIFYRYQNNSEVKGAAGVPLIANASVASDRSLIPTGSVMLVNVPILDDRGNYQGKNETRLVVALDTGSAIKGQHLDLYFGTGDRAGKQAGFYSHYAPVWLIKP